MTVSPERASRGGVVRRLLREARPYLPRFAVAMGLGILAGLGPLSYIEAIRIIGDDLGPHGHRSVMLLLLVVAGVFVVQVIANVASYGQNYLTAWSGQRLIANFRVRLFERIMTMPLGEFDKWRPGELLARFTNDLQLMTDAVSISLPQLVQTTVTFVGAFAYMLYQDWLLTVFLILFAPLFNYAVLFFTRLISAGSKRVQERVADLSSNLSEVIQNERIVKAFGREEHETERFRGSNEQFFNAYMKLTQFSQTQTPVVAMITAVAVLAVFLFTAREVLVGRMTAGDMVAYATAVALTLNPLQRFASFIGDLARGLVGAGRIFEILDLPVEPLDEEGALSPPSFAGAVKFENVTFAYHPDSTPVLREFSVEIEGGEIAALVGPSGSGKTTIANLVPRFFEPQRGRITIDGIDLQRIRLRTLRDQIGIVSQEPLLFSGTIADNIRYGRLDATQVEVELAAREANAEEFIIALPHAYETLLGERGIRLSGGQRQRIAIARAVLRDPRILILDEATSSLDTHSERLIEEALDQLLHGRTTLIIAHRLSTIRRANKIFYIDAGRIVEVGTHDDLLARGGPYAELHAAQFAH
jgi:subfamily B ATP-binding cassette protein MsbA